MIDSIDRMISSCEWNGWIEKSNEIEIRASNRPGEEFCFSEGP
jgi:hypothetical protein